MFQKGQSGNPGGRPKGYAGLARKIKEFVGEDGDKLVAAAIRIMLNADGRARASDQMQAIQWLADRGFGKAVQPVEMGGGLVHVGLNGGFDLTRLTPDERDNLLGFLERACGLGPGSSPDPLQLPEAGPAGETGSGVEGEPS